MWPLDITLFLATNATAATPAWVLALAHFSSSILPAVLIALLLLGLLLGPRPLRNTLLQAVLSVALAWCLVHLVRALVPFPRPAELGLGIQWIEHGRRPGFPSMHSTVAFAFAGTLALRRATGWALCAGIAAALIAWSRVCLGVHFPSDVVVGMFTGLLCASIVAAGWHLVKRQRNTAQAPLSRSP